MTDVLAQPADGVMKVGPSTTVAGAAGGRDVTVVEAIPGGERGAVHSADRLRPLDGWRGLSILCVLACHMLPIGPKSWALNEAAGLLGMSIFFSLSGFLITSMLLRRLDLRAFFIRRGCRILPLVLMYITVALTIVGAPGKAFLAEYGFITNYYFSAIPDRTGHLWSICVEIHFYLFIGLITLMFRRWAFWLLPICCVAVTLLRVHYHSYQSITTHLRVDEILTGACLAMVYNGFVTLGLKRILSLPMLQPMLTILLLLSCHESGGWLNYLRPYFAAGLVGSTLLQRNALQRFLMKRWIAYIAAISYALYIIHPLSMYGWLGSGNKIAKYAKRPLCFAISFVLAHLSTFYFEKYWIGLGKRWSSDKRQELSTQPV